VLDFQLDNSSLDVFRGNHGFFLMNVTDAILKVKITVVYVMAICDDS
jgi:hypothetical protein